MHRRPDCTGGRIAQAAVLHTGSRIAPSIRASPARRPVSCASARPVPMPRGCSGAAEGPRLDPAGTPEHFFTPAHVFRHLLGMSHAPLASSRRGGQNEYGHIHNRAPPGQCFSECFTCAMWPHVRCGDWPHVCHGAAEDLRLDRAGTPIRIHAYGHV